MQGFNKKNSPDKLVKIEDGGESFIRELDIGESMEKTGSMK
jgi:hypothetical protein